MAEPRQRLARGLRIARVVRAFVALGPSAQELQAQVQRLEIIPQVVRQYGHQLLGRRPPAFVDGAARDALGELCAVRENADPAADRFGEARILRAEIIGLARCDHHHAAARAANFERHADLRLDAQPLLYAAQLFGVILQLAGEERLAGLVDVDDAATV